jgi:hypothetical protein
MAGLAEFGTFAFLAQSVDQREEIAGLAKQAGVGRAASVLPTCSVLVVIGKSVPAYVTRNGCQLMFSGVPRLGSRRRGFCIILSTRRCDVAPKPWLPNGQTWPFPDIRKVGFRAG